MIRSHTALLRMAQDFFRAELLHLYRWDQVKIAAAEEIPAAERRKLGQGKYREEERLIFPPWEILIYSSNERPPLGEIVLRKNDLTVFFGPLDAAEWKRIGLIIRSEDGKARESRPSYMQG